jgi:putative acetyltransferase
MSLPAGVRIRVAGPGDAPFIQQVHEDSIRGLGPRAYSRAEVESWAGGLKPTGYVWAMTQGGEDFLLAEADRIVAFCSFAADEVRGLYVHPAWAGRGIGRELLVCAEAAIRAGGHERARIGASLTGQRFYAAQGYRIVAKRGWKTRGGLVLEIADMEKSLGVTLAGRQQSACRSNPAPAVRVRGRHWR